MKFIKQISLPLLMMMFLSLTIIQCCDSEQSKLHEQAEQAKIQSIKKCTETDGMPIFSIWDGDHMVDCKYKTIE